MRADVFSIAGNCFSLDFFDACVTVILLASKQRRKRTTTPTTFVYEKDSDQR
ncbi:hypothetical protein TSAR_009354 [Trichomalopsis sarcophagae]|uniref:Uncharacterized protein n=1 Tax=Trichomalopsis sarcophagae TaxID=543379 RepID=A0A232EMK5_9HYME|nr:hypothetical protein TSAR_009354 [Trichomalopsis sarcophagae]